MILVDTSVLLDVAVSSRRTGELTDGVGTSL